MPTPSEVASEPSPAPQICISSLLGIWAVDLPALHAVLSLRPLWCATSFVRWCVIASSESPSGCPSLAAADAHLCFPLRAPVATALSARPPSSLRELASRASCLKNGFWKKRAKLWGLPKATPSLPGLNLFFLPAAQALDYEPAPYPAEDRYIPARAFLAS